MKYVYRIHRWTSLICVLLFLLLCLTGLPLLFKEEINEWNQLRPPENPQPLSYATLWQGLEQGIQTIQADYPQKTIKTISAKADKGDLIFRLQDLADKKHPSAANTAKEVQLAYHVQTQTFTDQSTLSLKYPALQDCLQLLSSLHVRLGLGREGMLFLGFFCLLSCLSLLSGCWLYAPPLRKLAAGMLRNHSRRIFWSDWHKLTGLAAGMWALVLCLSGVMIVLFSLGYSSYLTAARSEAAQQLPAYSQNQVTVPPWTALQTASQALDNEAVIFLKMPEPKSNLYTLYIKPLAAGPDDFMGQPLFVAASAGEKSGPASCFRKPLPWYLPVIAVFVNLHTHNHALLATKIIWSVYSLITMAMIISGICVWLTRWNNTVYRQAPPLTVPVMVKSGWAILSIFGLLPLGGLAVSLYGGYFELAGALALFLPLLLFAMMWYKNKITS